MVLPANQILHGDCLEVLKTIPDSSVDSIVTDPPYGLGQKEPTPAELLAYLNGAKLAPVKKGLPHCLRNLFDTPFVDDSDSSYASFGQEVVSFQISIRNRPVSFRPVQLNDELSVWEEEIHHKGSCVSLKDFLMHKSEAVVDKPVLEAKFCLGVRKSCPCCVGVCGCFSYSGESVVRIAVRVLNYSPSEVEATSGEVTLQATECAAVLTLDVRSRSGKLSFTDGTNESGSLFLISTSQDIRASSRASSLLTLSEFAQSSSVTTPADRAVTFNLALPKRVAHRFHSRFTPGKDFMNKPWDIPPVDVWKECFRVLKPGGHLLAFAGTRTWDLMSMGIRMAGFENRDTIATEFGPVSTLQWLHSQGFPKSHSVDKAIDRKRGVTRKVVGTKRGVGGENLNDIVNGREVRQTTDEGGKGVGAYGTGAKQVGIDIPVTAPESDEAKQWAGWGTALKPSWEPILMFRKPLSEKTLVDQVLATGTGGINIDGCRVRNDGGGAPREGEASQERRYTENGGTNFAALPGPRGGDPSGRWPANMILVHSGGCKIVGSKKVKAPVINRFEDGMKPFGEGAGHEYTSTQTGDENGEEEVPVYECVEGCPVKALDKQSGAVRSSGGGGNRTGSQGGTGLGYMGAGSDGQRSPQYSDNGGASRFFAQFTPDPDAPFIYQAKAGPKEKRVEGDVEQHPTVKPLALMRYLVRLVTPSGGIVLDPYVGSGTTAVAAKQEGINFIGIEKHEPYVQRARLRLEQPTPEQTGQPEPAAPVAKTEASLLDLALSDDF